MATRWSTPTAVAVAGALMLATATIPVLAQSPTAAVREIPVAGGGFHARISPDGTRVAVFEDPVLLEYTNDPAHLPIRLVDLASGSDVAVLTGAHDFATDVAFSPNDDRLVSRHANGELVVWDLSAPSPAPIATFFTGAMGAGRIELLPDGRTAIVTRGAIPSLIDVVDTTSGAITAVMGPPIDGYGAYLEANRPGPPYDYWYVALAVSPDGTSLATATFNGEVAVRTIPDGAIRVLRPASERIGRMDIRGLQFVNGSASVWAYDHADEQLHAWDVATGMDSAFGSGGDPFAVDPASAQMVWLERDGDQATNVRVVDLGGSIAPFTLATLVGVPTAYASIGYALDGATIVVGGLTGPAGTTALTLIPAPW